MLARRHPKTTASLLLVLALALAVGAVWLAAVTAAKAGPGALQGASPLGGVNISGLYQGVPATDAEKEIARAKSLHAAIVRISIPWSVLEPTAAGAIAPSALSFTDRLVDSARAAGIRVIMTVDSTPCWASSAPASLRRRCVGARASAANAWPPVKPLDYAQFVAYLARRYGTRLAAIEIWNEPDQVNQLYFAGPDKTRRYAAIVRAAYPAIKAANPHVTVIAGSLVGSNGAFLRELYAAGIKGYYDGLAVHFYNLVLASVRSIREVQIANGDTKALWLDEFGWSTCYPRQKVQEEQACVTAPIQAANVADTFHALSHVPYVAAAVLYDMQDSGGEQFGVLSASGAHKPAYSTLAHVLASKRASAAGRVSLTLSARGGSTVARGSGPVGDFMQLEAFQGSVLRYRALFILDRFNRYTISLPAVLGEHGLRVRVYQYWSGSASAAQASD